jgi:hypothetical protein
MSFMTIDLLASESRIAFTVETLVASLDVRDDEGVGLPEEEEEVASAYILFLRV